MSIYIYTLIDPRTNEIRYIGQTYEPNRRAMEHVHKAKRGENNHKAKWIRLLLKQGLKPIMSIVEECNEDNWIEREQYWINYGMSQGWPLTNSTIGGEGTHGHKHSKETLNKISESLKRYNSIHISPNKGKPKPKGFVARKRTCKICGNVIYEIKKYRLCNICESKTKLCDCGCGKLIPMYLHNGRLRHYAYPSHNPNLIRKPYERHVHHSEEEKMKIRKKMSDIKKEWHKTHPTKGRKLSEEARKHISDGVKKRFANPEERKKMSDMLKGRCQSEESKKKNSESHKGLIPWSKGKKMSEETRRKVSESLKGNKRSLGHKHSEESKKKMSESHRRKHNER